MTHIYVAFMLVESMGYESKRYTLDGRVIAEVCTTLLWRTADSACYCTSC